MKVHRVKGKFRMGRRKGDFQRFSKEMISETKEDAIEKIYSVLGSKHRTKRTNIHIYEVSEVDEDEVEDYFIRTKIDVEE